MPEDGKNMSQTGGGSGTACTFAVAQLGARMHYAVPKILHRQGKLKRLYTDSLLPAWMRREPVRTLLRQKGPGPVKRLVGRHPEGIPDGLIRSFQMFGLWYAMQKAACRDSDDALRMYLRINPVFCRMVAEELDVGVQAIYTFNSSALEILEATRARACRTVLEQTIAPQEIESRIMAEERESWPGWERGTPSELLVREFCSREREEWNLAGQIVCGSDFVREGVVSAGGPRDKCVVVPYGVDPPVTSSPLKQRERELRVLFCGTLNLRKGVPYLLEVAKELAGKGFTFRAVGPYELAGSKVAELSEHIELTGSIPRTEVRKQFEWADVFVFPSMCEGSATVCYEALAAALPVITTPNAGSVVRDGIDGYIVPPRGVDIIVDRLRRLREDRALLETLSAAAVLRAQEFTVESYGVRLMEAIGTLTAQLPEC